jgi:hypothetical protein
MIVRVLGLDEKDFDAQLLEYEQHPERFRKKAAKIADEYREIKWERDESPKQYAVKVLATMLPRFKSRDEAMDALALRYPFVSKENMIMKIAGALYFMRTQPPDTHRVAPRDIV